MKVGILTYHWVSNMGANLQALSTYCYLKNNGYEPYILNWIPTDVEQFYSEHVLEDQRKVHEYFVKIKFHNISKVCRTSEEIAECIIENDLHFICIGSDAVFSTRPYLTRWHLGRRGLKYIRPYSDGTIHNPFWGDFIKYIPSDYTIQIVGLSISAQNTPYTKIIFKKEKQQYNEAIERFSKITVRDIWTKQMCEHVSFGTISPMITPDPVFGFNQNVQPENLDFIKNTFNIHGRYVLLSVSNSIQDVNWILFLEKYFEEKGIIVVGLPKTTSPAQNILKYNVILPLSPLEWYDAIKQSSGYIGELMHPILVSLHNGVPVFAFDTYGFKKRLKFDTASSKTYQILKDFDMLNNYYNPLYNKLPTPEEVATKILNTDTNKIKARAADYYQNYQNLMKYLLENNVSK